VQSSMQMGPALLPTPLSPACGHPVPRETSGGPSASLVSGRAWRPMSSLLLPCLAAGLARDLSPALAPASGFRSCPAAIAPCPKARVFAAMRSCLAETVPFADPGLRQLRLAPWLSPVSARFPACPVEPRRALLKRACLHSAEALCMPSLDGRGDMFLRHLWDRNQQNFKALRLFVPVDLCPEDKLKVRLKRRSGNLQRREFSTAPRITCGHGWISQRLVAFAGRGPVWQQQNCLGVAEPAPKHRCAKRPDSAFPRRQASRLRRASRRRRNPLSLMKPSASFWS
jgi:hypothetical protein